MSKLEARERYIALMLKELDRRPGGEDSNVDARGDNTARRGLAEKAKQKKKQKPQTSPSDHYTIAESERTPIDITAWLGSVEEDRATKAREASGTVYILTILTINPCFYRTS